MMHVQAYSFYKAIPTKQTSTQGMIISSSRRLGYPLYHSSLPLPFFLQLHNSLFDEDTLNCLAESFNPEEKGVQLRIHDGIELELYARSR
jgi:hypothetical protein